MLIATRTFTLQGTEGSAVLSVPTRLFKPELTEDGWICRIEIDWPEGTKATRVRDSDSVRSIVRALDKIAAEIEGSDYYNDGRLIWLYRGRRHGLRPKRLLRRVMRLEEKHARTAAREARTCHCDQSARKG